MEHLQVRKFELRLLKKLCLLPFERCSVGSLY